MHHYDTDAAADVHQQVGKGAGVRLAVVLAEVQAFARRRNGRAHLGRDAEHFFRDVLHEKGDAIHQAGHLIASVQQNAHVVLKAPRELEGPAACGANHQLFAPLVARVVAHKVQAVLDVARLKAEEVESGVERRHLEA
eukprot:scaffold2448_cov250-Pinguiococcus_pyrenoidosus.AAC.9